jgi:hypothetical protein
MALDLDPETPPASVRERLLHTARGTQRYAPFAATLARVFDLSVARMRQLLLEATDKAAFERAIVPGLRVIHFAAGPAIIGRHAGLARVRQGFEFPLHRHQVEEVTFILEGMLVESDGSVYGAGDILVRGPGTDHTLSVIEDSVLATLVGPVEAAAPTPG